jgi:signal transduction histidine kinase
MFTNLFQDASGVFWSVADDGIYRLHGRRFLRIPLRRSDARHFLDITIDRAGTVWVFDGSLGLLRLSGDSLIQVAPRSQPSYQHVYLFSDRARRIWVGEPQGPSLFANGQLRLFAASRGEGPADVNGFFEDRAGDIWVISGGGLSKFEGSRFRTIYPQAVYGIVEDDTGAWWIATKEGVLRLPPGEADRALADSEYHLRYRLFDQQDGLPGMITKGTSGTLVTRTGDGRIWVATDGGLATIEPRDISQNVAAPPVLIEAVRIDGRELAPADEIAVPPRSADLEIDYTATSLSIPERVRFRYQLEGTDETWREVGTRRRAYYSRLPPGRYRFRVMASNAGGVWNETGADLVLRVLPTWYQTAWFRSGLVLLIGALGAAAAALVQRRRHLLSQQALRGKYEATLAERTRLAGELHDTLFQAFTGVTLQLQALRRRMLTAPHEAEQDLGRMLKVADVALRDARSVVWDMRAPELEARDVAAALEAAAHEAVAAHCFAGGAPVHLEVTITGDRRRLSPAVETAAHRIGREAVANALHHAEAKCIRLAIVFEPCHLCVEVRDDGVGFDAAQLQPAEGRGHWGLVGMGERTRTARGTLDVNSAPGSGTTVLLRLPVEPA